MRRLPFLFWIFVPLLLAFACTKRPGKESSALYEKSEPYDLFAFQRSFPDRDFDWKGWRRQLARLRTEYTKLRNKYGWQDSGNAPDWTFQGPGNVAGRANTVAVKPGDENTLLAGFSGGGIFKSTDGGVNWKPVFDDNMELAIGDITYDPNNANVVYAGTGDPNIPAIVFNGNGLYKSTDGGETWQYLGLSQVGIISKVVVDPQNSATLYVGAMGNPYVRDINRGIYKSTDGGLTWQKVLFVSDQAGSSDLVINPADPKILYASFWDRIRNNQESTVYGPHAQVYKTTDGGETWTQLGGGLPTGIMGRTGLAISQQNPDKLYAVYIDSLSTPGGLFKSTDGGDSWAPVDISALEAVCADFGWYFGKIRLNPANDEEVYFLAILLWRKDAGSNQWQPVANAHADCHDLYFAPSGKRYLATDGGIYRNATTGVTWTKSNNLPTTQFYRTNFNPHEPDTYFAGAQDNGIRAGNKNVYNGWSSVFPADGFRCAFHPTDPNIFWVETQNGEVHKTIDGGNNWTNGAPCLGSADRCNWDMPYILSKYFPDRLYAGTYRVYFSEGGSGWGAISGDLTDGDIYGPRFHTISCLDESPVLESKLLAGTSDGNVWRREPVGNFINISAGLPDRYVTSVVASPTLPDRIFVTHSGFRDNEYIPHVHRSNNNGQTWTDISGDLPNMPVNDILVLPDHADSVLFAATDAGVYFSRNSGVHWQRLGSSMPFIPVFDLERNPVRNELVAATHARGLWTFPLDSIFQVLPSNTIAVTGTVKTEAGAGVSPVQVCDNPLKTTDANGAFELPFNAGCLGAGIAPRRNDDPLNGVSTFDLVLINKHILGIEALASPYKIIAADANNSNSVSTFDIVTLRKLILGIDTVLHNTDSWRFIPANYVFPNPANPFAEPFPEQVSLNLGNQPPPTPQVVQFVGIKVGDVNGNAAANLIGSPIERNVKKWPLYTENQVFNTGALVRCVFSAGWATIAGAQFTLAYDPAVMLLTKVEPLANGISPDHFAINPRGKSCLTVCLERPFDFTNTGEVPLFAVTFWAKTSGDLSRSISLGDIPTPAASFTPDGVRLRPVLQWGDRSVVAVEPIQAYPNPFGAGGVWLEGTGSGAALLRIFDVRGKTMLEKSVNGSFREFIPSLVFPQKGLYWYEWKAGASRVVGKLVYSGY